MAVAVEQLRDKMKVARARAKGGERKARRISLEAKFTANLEKAGFTPLHQFCGVAGLRPCVVVPEEKLQDVIRATRVRVRWSWTVGRKVKVWVEPGAATAHPVATAAGPERK